MALPVTHDLGTLALNLSSSDHTKTPTSPLPSIPRELRDEIYAYLLRCGDLVILRTSKQVGQEAKERLYREGVTRIKLGVPDDNGDRGFPFQQRWESIQNFHFRLFLRPGSTIQSCLMYGQLKRFARLNGSSLKRDCLITIEDDHSIPQAPVCHEIYEIKELYAEITRLACCIRLMKGFTPRPNETCFLCWDFIGIEHDGHRDIADKKLIVDNLHTLKGRLEPGDTEKN